MDLVNFFFTLTNQVKLYHWQTTSYARHVASDSLFSSLQNKMDKFMEVYQGKYGRVKPTEEGQLVVKLGVLNHQKVEAYLRSCIEYLQNLVDSGMVSAKDTDLLNIRDDIVGHINQTLYLFSFQ